MKRESGPALVRVITYPRRYLKEPFLRLFKMVQTRKALVITVLSFTSKSAGGLYGGKIIATRYLALCRRCCGQVRFSQREGNMQVTPSDDGNREAVSRSTSRRDLDETRAIDLMAELIALLDEYGPSWYSEDYYERAHAALRLLRDR